MSKHFVTLANFSLTLIYNKKIAMSQKEGGCFIIFTLPVFWTPPQKRTEFALAFGIYSNLAVISLCKLKGCNQCCMTRVLFAQWEFPFLTLCDSKIYSGGPHNYMEQILRVRGGEGCNGEEISIVQMKICCLNETAMFDTTLNRARTRECLLESSQVPQDFHDLL